ncbi:MAG: aminoglycoside phosphotransferase family protein [Mycobacterium sp.]|nr:aminoglycoside phosphotransferase family protein [Mycobacterium sp.]
MTAGVPIPRSPDDVTPQWLGHALGVEVAHVGISPIGTGQTGATYRVTASYLQSCSLPATFAIKLPSQDESVRERVAIGYRSEHAFYTNIARHVDVPVPVSHYCEIGNDGADFALLLGDLAPAEQGDQLAGCSVAEAVLAVRALAGLHGPSWCEPKWADFPGISMPKATQDFANGLGEVAKMAAEITLEKLGSRMSEADRDTLRTSMSMVAPWLMTEPDRYALLHGDYRLDNMLFAPDRTKVTIVDWQTIGNGLPARDLAYFAATSLPPDVRAASERQLVDTYYDELLRYGITDYDRNTCWRDYRLGMLQAPLLIVLGTAFATSTERGDDMMLVMTARSGQAIRELGSMDLVSAA